ncbi:MAG: HAD family hydrolase [Lentisphaeria bacterium]
MMERTHYLELISRYQADYLIFDLGGVLVDVAPPVSVADDCCDIELPPLEVVEQRCRYIPEVEGFETGEATPEEFGEAVVSNFSLPLSIPDFLMRYKSLIKGVIPAMESLLQELTAADYGLACLSNTNPLHWQWVQDNTRLPQYFHEIFLSFEMGLVKPDTEIFCRVLEKLDIDARKVLFFDDKMENVQAARNAGINAEAVITPQIAG